MLGVLSYAERSGATALTLGSYVGKLKDSAVKAASNLNSNSHLGSTTNSQNSSGIAALLGNNSPTKLEQLRAKVGTGAKLTQAERRYLQSEDPITYTKLLASEAELKRYEAELKRCKTKEEVQRLRLSKVTASMSTINNIKNNTSMSSEQKASLIGQEGARVAGIIAASDKFISTAEYKSLPTEAEERIARKEEREEREQYLAGEDKDEKEQSLNLSPEDKTSPEHDLQDQAAGKDKPSRDKQAAAEDECLERGLADGIERNEQRRKMPTLHEGSPKEQLPPLNVGVTRAAPGSESVRDRAHDAYEEEVLKRVRRSQRRSMLIKKNYSPLPAAVTGSVTAAAADRTGQAADTEI
ncbi:MAG: hypothetical protein IJ228_05895 [Succinivibrio sp.]|nr:hypothetical protein [Succinivibrio sp.]